MRYKRIGFKEQISAISVGTWPAGNDGYGVVDDDTSVKSIVKMIECGVNCIDTAPDYGNGHSELVVGRALKELDRSKVLVSTKGGASALSMKAIRTGAPYARDGRYGNILYECEQSLRRLGTDYIDIYYVHWPDTNTSFTETMDAMNTLKKQGKIRYVGLSNFNREQILACDNVCKIDFLQPPYSMVVRKSEDLMKWARSSGINTMTYGSLGGGILTGAFRELTEFSPSDPRNRFYPFFKEPYFSQVAAFLKEMDKLAGDLGKPLSQIAINWQTQKRFITTALVGVRNPQEAIENCGAFEWELTEEEIAVIDGLIAKYMEFPDLWM